MSIKSAFETFIKDKLTSISRHIKIRLCKTALKTYLKLTRLSYSNMQKGNEWREGFYNLELRDNYSNK